jgi:thiamine-phosphate pyrophosphorylase
MALSQSQAAVRRKLLAAARMGKPAFARNGRRLPAAWFMTDPKRTPDIEKIVARLPRGWGMIFRHFGAADRCAVARAVVCAARARGVVVLVAGDAELARVIGADGVHWPEAKLRAARARHPRWIETASAHGRAGLARAKAMGVDAAILSPVFESASPSAGKPMDALAFRLLARGAGLPVYALGGVNARTAARAGSGAAGFAAVDAIVEGWGS